LEFPTPFVELFADMCEFTAGKEFACTRHGKVLNTEINAKNRPVLSN
jgi:hypothetical protein